MKPVEQIALLTVVIEPELRVHQASPRHPNGGKRPTWDILVRHANLPPICARWQNSRAMQGDKR
jgi:hypothetical protein